MKRLWGIVSLIVLLCTVSMAVNAQTSNQELFNNITMEKNNEKVTFNDMFTLADQNGQWKIVSKIYSVK